MGQEIRNGFLTKMDIGWCVLEGDKLYRVVDEDAIFCLDSDYGTTVSYCVVENEMGIKMAKLEETVSEEMSWDEIEQWYDSDNYPPFGGPFTDAMKPFEWLRIYFNPPKRKA